jgi:hypothetical protein
VTTLLLCESCSLPISAILAFRTYTSHRMNCALARSKSRCLAGISASVSWIRPCGCLSAPSPVYPNLGDDGSLRLGTGVGI